MSLGQKEREILLNQLSTWYNSRKNYSSLYIGMGSLKKRKKPKTQNLDQKQIQKSTRIRPETIRCRLSTADPKLWQILTLCKTLSTTHVACCRQHISPIDTYLCLRCRQSKKTVDNPVPFFHTYLKNSILNLFDLFPHKAQLKKNLLVDGIWCVGFFFGIYWSLSDLKGISFSWMLFVAITWEDSLLR